MSIILYNLEKKTFEYIDNEKVLTEIYEQHYKVPTGANVKQYMKKNKDNISDFFGKNISSNIKKIKEQISRLDNKIPLFDIYTENLYLVNRSNIYDKIMHEYYRFPTAELLEKLKNKKEKIEEQLIMLQGDTENIEKELKKKLDINKLKKESYQIFQEEKMLIRTRNKIIMLLDFMESFDLSILYNTYVNTIYSYSSELGKNLTLCERPSFTYHFKHLSPYYTRSEIINIALNMGIIHDDKTYYDDDKVKVLCNKIGSNDINSQIIINHQKHIIKNQMIGLVQYYSLQGSYFMNQYLRGQVAYNCQNKHLESLIQPMWKLILSAPKFDKTYILYRFVQTDSFLSTLKIGEEFVEKGFMSTTRDPFYHNENYKFGWILMKIKLPETVQGCALCIEPFSLFPKEEEIILAPNTKLKLLRKDEKSIYYHIDKTISNKVRTMYEFEVVGNTLSTTGDTLSTKGDTPIIFPERPIYDLADTPVDFLQLKKSDAITIEEKIHQFVNNNVNRMSQFSVVIGEQKFIINSEWYDSSGVYGDYYQSRTKNGYSMYCIFNNHLLFVIEIGEQYDVPYMYVNYHIKYTTLNRDDVISGDNFLTLIASISYYFDIPNIILYADYLSCDYMEILSDNNQITKFYGGTVCMDFYNYLKFGKKKYEDYGVLNIELLPQFRYHQLDVMKKLSPDTILKRLGDKKTVDRIYQLYDKTYKNFTVEINNTIANLYIWIVENNCFLLNELVSKFSKIPQYEKDNPFKTDFYIFNSMAYLYNRKKIDMIPEQLNNLSMEKILIQSQNKPMNRYRLSDDQRQR